MTKRTDRWAVHFWTIREINGDVNSPVLIALPRDAHTLEIMGMPPVEVERTIIVTRDCGVPETVIVALPGRRAADVIDHPIFDDGARGADAIITWAMIDEFGLKLVLDRRVQPNAIPGGFDYAPTDQAIIDDQADDTPLGQDDQSWRDLTDEQIEEIRRA